MKTVQIVPVCTTEQKNKHTRSWGSDMKKNILKRFLTTDRSGRVIVGNTERITDNGHGRLSLTTRRSTTRCPSCHRPITDINGLRGSCDYCGTNSCCESCDIQCHVCSRRLCGHCRRGFVGQNRMTVCPICLDRLRRWQASQDHLLMQKTSFERRLLGQRERTRLQALRLQAERARMMGQLQAARIRTTSQVATAKLRMTGQLAAIREINRLRIALAKERQRNGRYLR